MSKSPVVAIDGPAGSGKTTLAEALATRLGLLYYDTGALYRALTLAAIERGIPLDDEQAIAELARNVRIELLPPGVDDDRPYTVRLDGRDVTAAIRSPEVDRRVSTVAAHPAVRQALLAVQRAAAERGGVVLVGRDVGTVIAPDATVKIYLEASPRVRADRRWRQLRSQGVDVSLEDVLRDVIERDARDSSRATAPLRAAPDAVVLGTDHLAIDEMVDRAEAIVRDAPRHAAVSCAQEARRGA